MMSDTNQSEGKTYFDEPGLKHFRDVRTVEAPKSGKGVHADDFLLATDALLGILGRLGSAFNLIHSDISNNVTKVRTKHQSDPVTFVTMESMLAGPKDTATEGMVWLIRALDFTSLALERNLSEKGKEELSASFRHSYDKSLKQHHSFVVRPVVQLALKACPNRGTLFVQLGSPESLVIQKMDEWVAAFRTNVMAIKKAISEGKHDKGL